MMKSRVQELCRERGMTEYELAGRSGVAVDTLYGWRRRGLDGATLGCVARVARALGVPVEETFEEVRRD